jgi:hypothetical protein
MALLAAGRFEGTEQVVRIAYAGGEAADRARVVVVRDGLFDDSLRGERWDMDFVRGEGGWRLASLRRAWRCRRAAVDDAFATSPCR